MKIFLIIFNILCISAIIFGNIGCENNAKEFLQSVGGYTLLLGFILLIRRLYLALAKLWEPYSSEKEAIEYKYNCYECTASIIMSVFTLFTSIIESLKSEPTIKYTISTMIIWGLGRFFWEYLKRKVYTTTNQDKEANIININNAEKTRENQIQTEKYTIPDSRKLDLLKECFQWIEIESGIWAIEFNQTKDSKIIPEEEIKVKGLINLSHLSNSLIKVADTEYRAYVKVGDPVAKYAIISDYYKIAGFDSFIKNQANINSPIEGILQLLVVSVDCNGSFNNYFHNIKNGQRLLTVSTLDKDINNFKIDIALIEERKCKEEQERKATLQREQEEKEKEEIRQRLLKQKRKRELERKVQQEMIENGELTMEGTKRRHIPHCIVSEVYRRDGGKCVLCGSTENLQLDHIIPFSKGGADTAENLQVLCQKCNLEKSNKI